MDYIFQLGTFPYLSLAEIFSVLASVDIKYTILGVNLRELHINIENISPEVLMDILGGTRSIKDLANDIEYVQSIKDYKKREFSKPKVDPKSGLLPSKLAKMLINLSITPNGVKKIYDPFCGGGTIITESMVMGISGIGSDKDPKTVKDAVENAKWIEKAYNLSHNMFEFFQSDIKDIDTEKVGKKGIGSIVTEPYLGIATNKILRMSKSDRDNVDRVNDVITICLKKSSAILKKGQRLVIIIPQFRTTKGIVKLPIAKSYNRYSFKKLDLLEGLDIEKKQDLLYYRPKAVVLREIFILEKI